VNSEDMAAESKRQGGITAATWMVGAQMLQVMDGIQGSLAIIGEELRLIRAGEQAAEDFDPEEFEDGGPEEDPAAGKVPYYTFEESTDGVKTEHIEASTEEEDEDEFESRPLVVGGLDEDGLTEACD
jgi:hypothetical protein